MHSVDEALKLVLENTPRQSVVELALGPALLGLVLAEEVASDMDVPPFDKSLMDGYALRSVDSGSGRRLTVVEEIMAGMVPQLAVGEGQSSRIMTGAPLPLGADAVIQQEKVTVHGQSIELQDVVPVGRNILAAGAEMKQGEVVLKPGHCIRPQELGLLATLGRTTAQVYRPPSVAILSTGDEVVEAGQTLAAGQIRNSNSPMLAGQVTRTQAIPKYLGIAKDERESLVRLISEGLKAEVLILSGGVSVGDKDLVPVVLQELGVQAIFHKVAMKPGKPLFFGKRDRTLVFGLPGNPVSGMVGFELFVRPALKKLLGYPQCDPKMVLAKFLQPHRHKSDRPTYFPVALSMGPCGYEALPLPWQGSPDLRTVCRSDGFALLPVGEVEYAVGSEVRVLLPQ